MAPTLLIGLLGCSPAATGWMVEARGQVVDLQGHAARAELALVHQGAALGEVATDSEGWWSLPILVEHDDELELALQAQGDAGSGLAWLDLETYGLGPALELHVGLGQGLDLVPLTLPSVTLGDGSEQALGFTLVDASTGLPAPRVELSLYEGWDAPADRPVVAQLASDNEGRVRGLVPAGLYTARVSGQEGWSDAVFPVRSGEDDQLGLLVPALSEQELAVALSHGTTDLDLHLVGPRAGTGGIYDVWPGSPLHPVDASEPVATWSEPVEGAQLAMVHEVRSSGSYLAAVFDGGDAPAEDSTTLSDARPVLQLFSSEGPAMAQASPGREATAWIGLVADRDEGTVRLPEDYRSGLDPEDPDSF